MNGRRRSAVVGYCIVLAGAAVFVVGCFLPYVETGPLSSRAMSIWQLSTVQGSMTETLGAAANLFPGPIALVAISVWAIRDDGRWSAPALIATTVVWSLARIGGLTFTYSVYDGHMGIGFWLMLVGVAVVIAGTVVALVSGRGAGDPEA